MRLGYSKSTMDKTHWIVGLIILIILGCIYKGGGSPAPSYVNQLSSSFVPPPPKNVTELGFVKPEQRLFKLFASLSAGPKIKLGGTCSQMIFDRNTIPAEYNEKVVALARKMVDMVQHLSGNEYYMKTVENLYILQDKASNARYIIDFFVYDVKNYYTIRLLTDIVVIGDTHYLNYLNVQTASSPTLLNKYDIKFDSAGILFGDNMFHENIANLFDQYYLNSFKVIGVSDTSLEYSKEDLSEVTSLNAIMNGYFPSSLSSDTVQDLTNKGLAGQLDMFLPPGQNTVEDPLFCRKYTNEWDTHGVPFKNQFVPSACIRNNNGTQAKINDPWFGPGLIYQRSSDDAYSWLKDPGRGFIANNLDNR
jgi:hypothetical protein